MDDEQSLPPVGSPLNENRACPLSGPERAYTLRVVSPDVLRVADTPDGTPRLCVAEASQKSPPVVERGVYVVP